MTVRYFVCLANVVFSCAAFAGSVSYTYDSLGRLTTVVNSAGPNVTYEYDPLGNFTQRIVATPPSAAPMVTGSSIGIGSVTFTFTPPSTYTGATITGYVATCGSLSASVSASATSVTVIGLVRGTAYSCTLAANSAVGTGPPSAIQNIVGGSQTITVASGAILIAVNRQLAVTATSGLSVTLTSNTPATCSVVTGTTVRGVATGPCSLRATQAGDSNFLAATPVSMTLPVISPAVLFSILGDD